MKLKINKACDLASISVLPPRRPRGSGGSGSSASASAAASQQRSKSMSQQSFSQGGGASFSQGVGSGGASFSQGRGGSGAPFSQGSGGGGEAFSQIGGGGATFSQVGGSGGAAFSQAGGSGGAAFSQAGGSGGTAFSQDGGGGGASFSQGGGGGGAAFSQGGGGRGALLSQGGGGGGASFSHGGGSASLLHSQSQISQASLDENLLGLLRPSPARAQRFALHDDSSKRMSSVPANSASSVREESQLQLAKLPSNPIHRWNSSLPDSRCQVNEDVERKFQHVASSVHKIGMVLDSVQNDVMQLNRAMKEASLDSGSMQKKFVLVENTLQQILKGQDDLKALLLGSTKSNPDQMSVLNSHTGKLDEISSTLSVLKQVQEELKQLKGDIFGIFTKEMEGIFRAIRLLNTRPDAIQMLADQSCTNNTKLLMNQTPVENQIILMNQRPVADGTPKMNQTPVANGRPQKKQKPVANGKSQMRQAPVANGKPQKKQKPVPNRKPQVKKTPVANGRPQNKQTPVQKGKPQMKQTPVANGQAQLPQMNQVAEANGKPLMKQIAAAKDASVPAAVVYHRKVQDVEPRVEDRKAQKMVASSCCRVAPKREELAIEKVNPQVPTKAPFSIIIDLDDEEGSDGGVILKTKPGAAVAELTDGEEVSEDALEILRRARKRRRREATQCQAIVPFHE